LYILGAVPQLHSEISFDRFLVLVTRSGLQSLAGMIWIFDRLVEANILTKKEAATKLKELVARKFHFSKQSTLSY
jgi:hypothetical protein